MASVPEDPELAGLGPVPDPERLLERFSAEQVRAVERRVRFGIEQKREELRQMVGERYRDLIHAADTIRDMRRCADSLLQAVRDTDRYCQQLRQSRTLPGPGTQEVKQNQRPVLIPGEQNHRIRTREQNPLLV